MIPPLYKICVFWLLVVTGPDECLGQKSGLTVECMENVMTLTLDSSLSLGRQLEVEAINGSQVVTLTDALASQCGYSFEFDPRGNMKVYTSLLSCFTRNQGDDVFDIGLRLQLFGNRLPSDVFEVEKTCEYNKWASREILCQRNFMEVSVYKGAFDLSAVKHARPAFPEMSRFSADQQASTTLHDIWRMVFYTPKEKPMMLSEFKEAGYGISITPTRLVLRSPYNTPETYTEDINGVQMEVFKVSTYFKQAWSVTIVDSAAACPTGGLHFTDELITWYMPYSISPLIDAPDHQMLEHYMGINGKRLSEAEMVARGYTMRVTEHQIIITLPIGGPDGFYKSSVLDNEYYVLYSIDPMLEMVWLQGQSEHTRYKVHYPIFTPPDRQSFYVTDNALADTETFRITLGPFLTDVELLNITLLTGELSVEEANGRGFNVQQHLLQNGSKAFSITIPFSDPAVLKSHVEPINILYSLPVTFGMLVLPEFTPFSHSTVAKATRQDIRAIFMTGVCDDTNFYISIGHKGIGVDFHLRIGARNHSADLFTEYDVTDNGTHINITVPSLAPDVVFEKASQSSLRARVNVVISYNNWDFKNFSLACTFPLIMTECFPNGSLTALAIKVKSALDMIPGRLTLRDPSCKPVFSNSRFAYFSFNANSCQTTRTFHSGIMTYQNTISQNGSDYSVKVVCHYKLTKTLAATFSAAPQASALVAEPGFGELPVRMRLARDASYDSFHVAEVPVVQYLKYPLYFEVELLQSTDPHIEIVLDNCWASAIHSGTELRWDLVVDGCVDPADRYQITFYPVTPDARIQYPTHVRRFKMEMFTFVKDNVPLHDQILVHCETLLCDVHRLDSVCNATCPLPNAENVKRERRNVAQKQHRMWVSSGKISLSSL